MVAPPPESEASELMMGYLVPTMMEASWLLSVRMRGAESTLAPASSSIRCIRMVYCTSVSFWKTRFMPALNGATEASDGRLAALKLPGATSRPLVSTPKA